MTSENVSEENLQISLFCGICTLALLIVFLVLRLGRDDYYNMSAFFFAGAGLLFTFLPLSIKKLLLTRVSTDQVVQSVFLNEAFLSICVLLLCTICGILFPHVGGLAGVLSASGYILFVAYFVSGLRQKKLSSLFVCSSLFLGLSLAMIIFCTTYHHYLFREKLMVGKPFFFAADVFFHSSIANMIGNIGRISTGIDGTPFNPYYIGIHFLIAQCSKLFDQDNMSFFLYGYPLVFVPLLFKSMSLFYLETARSFGCSNTNLKYFLPLASLCTLGILPRDLSNKIWLGLPFSSESYGLSLLVSFFVSCLILHQYRLDKEASKQDTKPNLQANLFWIIAVPFLGSLITICKFSTMYAFLGIFGYLLLRKTLFKNWKYNLSYILSASIAFAIYKKMSFPYQTVIDWLSFYRQMQPLVVILHALFFYLSIWILIALTVKEKTVTRFKQALEIGVVFSIICFVPSLIYDMKGGAVIYFVEPQYWLSLILLLACLIPFAINMPKRAELYIYAGMLIQLFFSSLNLYNDSKHDSEILKAAKPAASRLMVLNKLEELKQLPPRLRRSSAVFIPQSHKDYWLMLDDITVPFLAPSITGMPLIDGLPPKGFIGTMYYGYKPYGFGMRPPGEQDTSAAAINTRATAWGFKHLIRLDDPGLDPKVIDLYGK